MLRSTYSLNHLYQKMVFPRLLAYIDADHNNLLRPKNKVHSESLRTLQKPLNAFSINAFVWAQSFPFDISQHVTVCKCFVDVQFIDPILFFIFLSWLSLMQSLSYSLRLFFSPMPFLCKLKSANVSFTLFSSLCKFFPTIIQFVWFQPEIVIMYQMLVEINKNTQTCFENIWTLNWCNQCYMVENILLPLI